MSEDSLLRRNRLGASEGERGGAGRRAVVVSRKVASSVTGVWAGETHFLFCEVMLKDALLLRLSRLLLEPVATKSAGVGATKSAVRGAVRGQVI